MEEGNNDAAAAISLLDVHGALMVLAWLGLIPVAIFVARYMRDCWPQRRVFGVKVWFQIHRIVNVIAVLLIAVAFSIAFYAQGKWTGPWFGRDSAENTSAGAWHSMFGLFAVLLAVRQPFSALLRCAPDHPRRRIFNWCHRIAGIMAYLLAMIPLFIGVFLHRHLLQRRLDKWLLFGFQIALLTFVLIAESFRWLISARQHENELLLRAAEEEDNEQYSNNNNNVDDDASGQGGTNSSEQQYERVPEQQQQQQNAEKQSNLWLFHLLFGFLLLLCAMFPTLLALSILL